MWVLRYKYTHCLYRGITRDLYIHTYVYINIYIYIYCIYGTLRALPPRPPEFTPKAPPARPLAGKLAASQTCQVATCEKSVCGRVRRMCYLFGKNADNFIVGYFQKLRYLSSCKQGSPWRVMRLH